MVVRIVAVGAGTIAAPCLFNDGTRSTRCGFLAIEPRSSPEGAQEVDALLSCQPASELHLHPGTGNEHSQPIAQVTGNADRFAA